jgi:predicted transcriptional regulator
MNALSYWKQEIERRRRSNAIGMTNNCLNCQSIAILHEDVDDTSVFCEPECQSVLYQAEKLLRLCGLPDDDNGDEKLKIYTPNRLRPGTMDIDVLITILGSLPREILIKILEIEIELTMETYQRLIDLNRVSHDLYRKMQDIIIWGIRSIDDADVTRLMTDTELVQYKSLIKLNINENYSITDKGIKTLINLQHLNLTSNGHITDEGIKLLTNLRQLNLSFNRHITDKGIRPLYKLQHLNLTGNASITDEGIKLLTGLQHLALPHNARITDDGIKLLTGLQHLNLSDNLSITDKGIKLLTGLQHLDLSYNESITDEGIKLLINLERLILSYNESITKEGVKLLTKLQ